MAGADELGGAGGGFHTPFWEGAIANQPCHMALSLACFFVILCVRLPASGDLKPVNLFAILGFFTLVPRRRLVEKGRAQFKLQPAQD